MPRDLFESNRLSSDLPRSTTHCPSGDPGSICAQEEREASAGHKRVCPPYLTTSIDALVIFDAGDRPETFGPTPGTRRHFATTRPPSSSFSEMPPLNSAQKALVAQFVAATGANEKTAQRVRQRCFPYEVMSCLPWAVLFNPVPILCCYYYPEKALVFRKGSLSTLFTSPDLYIRLLGPGSNPALLSAGLSTHRSPPSPFSLDFTLMSWAKQFLKNANYRLDLAADT